MGKDKPTEKRISSFVNISVALAMLGIGLAIGSLLLPESYIVKYFIGEPGQDVADDEIIFMGSGTVKTYLEDKVEGVSFIGGPSLPSVRSFAGICEDDISKNLKLIAMSSTDAPFLEREEKLGVLDQGAKIVRLNIGKAYLQVIAYPKEDFDISNDSFILVDELYDIISNNRMDIFYKTSANSGTEKSYLNVIRQTYPTFNFPDRWRLFDKNENPSYLFEPEGGKKRTLILCNSIYTNSSLYEDNKSIGVYKLNKSTSDGPIYTNLYLFFRVYLEDEKDGSNIYKPDEAINKLLKKLSHRSKDFYYENKYQKDNTVIIEDEAFIN